MSNFLNYDPKIITIYEILGSYFTDTLFNIKKYKKCNR